jgi:hypothetical protein
MQGGDGGEKKFGRQKISEVAEKHEIHEILEISGQIQTNLKKIKKMLEIHYKCHISMKHKNFI